MSVSMSMRSKRTWSRLSLALWLSLLSGALGASLKTPLAPSRIPRSSMRRIKGYADVLFPRPANCVLFAHEPGVADQLVARVAQGLGRPVMAKNALDTLLMQRYCEGLVILAETTSALAVFMQRAVAANWSFRVLALMVADGEPKDTRAFTLEQLDLWRSYDILWIEFGPRRFIVRQYLIHQWTFQPTTLPILSSDLRRNKFLNFNQREMNVSAFSCPLFVVFKRHDDDGQPNSVRDIDGIEYRIFLEFARILNFRWTMTVPRGRDKWGMPRWKDEPPRGMVQMLIERKIELAICSWWLEVAKKKYIDLSTYWHSCCMTFLLPKPEPYSIQWSAFLRPFSIDLWLALILTTCFIAAVYWMNFDFRTRSIQPVISFERSFLQIYSMLLMNDGYNPEGKGNRKFNRFLLTLWGIFTLNIVSAYSGSLAARLTLPEFEPMIHTPEGLSEKNYLFSAYYLSSWLGYMTQRYKLKLRLINTTEWEPEDGRQTAFFTKRVGDKYFMEVEQLPLALLKDMRASKVCIEQYFMTFALPRGSGLGRFLNPIIRRLVEAGITTHWLNRVFESQYTLFPFEQAYEYRDRQAVQVKLSFFYLQSAFLLWFVGHALAAIAFLAETTKHWRQETRIRRLLRPDREPGFKFSKTK